MNVTMMDVGESLMESKVFFERVENTLADMLSVQHNILRVLLGQLALDRNQYQDEKRRNQVDAARAREMLAEKSRADEPADIPMVEAEGGDRRGLPKGAGGLFSALLGAGFVVGALYWEDIVEWGRGVIDTLDVTQQFDFEKEFYQDVENFVGNVVDEATDVLGRIETAFTDPITEAELDDVGDIAGTVIGAATDSYTAFRDWIGFPVSDEELADIGEIEEIGGGFRKGADMKPYATSSLRQTT